MARTLSSLRISTCSVYKLTIFRDGKVVYEGTHFVSITGIQIFQISRGKFKELVDEFYIINYFSPKDESVDSIADLPTTIISITIDDKTKK